jgi:sulfite exporter TauE/SafE
LLYAALLLAALGGGAPQGAVLMALFALGSAAPLLLGPMLWLRLREGAGLGAWGARLAGLALAGSSGWALWHALAHDAAPWCVS